MGSSATIFASEFATDSTVCTRRRPDQGQVCQRRQHPRPVRVQVAPRHYAGNIRVPLHPRHEGRPQDWPRHRPLPLNWVCANTCTQPLTPLYMRPWLFVASCSGLWPECGIVQPSTLCSRPASPPRLTLLLDGLHSKYSLAPVPHLECHHPL